MGNKLYKEEYIQDISNAIREQTETDNTYDVSEMADVIRHIPKIGNFREWLSNPTNTTLILPDAITTIGESAFRGLAYSLYDVDFPDSLQVIGGQAFRGCVLLSTINFKNVTSLGGASFRGCTGITEITLPGTINTIKDKAFMECTSLKTVTFTKGEFPFPTDTVAADIFLSCTALTDIYVYWNSSSSIANAPWGAPEGCIIHYTDKDMIVQADGSLE